MRADLAVLVRLMLSTVSADIHGDPALRYLEGPTSVTGSIQMRRVLSVRLIVRQFLPRLFQGSHVH